MSVLFSSVPSTGSRVCYPPSQCPVYDIWVNRELEIFLTWRKQDKDRYFLSVNCAYHYCEMCCVGYVLVCVVYVGFFLYKVHDD